MIDGDSTSHREITHIQYTWSLIVTKIHKYQVKGGTVKTTLDSASLRLYANKVVQEQEAC